LSRFCTFDESVQPRISPRSRTPRDLGHPRKPKFADTRFYDLFPLCLEAMRLRFRIRIYGYVVMPEHVHLLVSEPEHGNLAEAMHYLKLSFCKRAKSLRAPGLIP
jgi:hypothetical protein